jgi:hypothetical protein
LSHESDDRGNHLVSKSLIALNTDLGVDGNGIVLDSAHTSHLRSDLDRDGKPKSSEARFISEKLTVTLGRSFVLEGKTLLDLVKLSPYPRIVHITVRVKFGKSLETFLFTAVVNQPTGRFGEEENKSSQENRGQVLNTERDAPLARVVVADASVCSVTDCCGYEGAYAKHELLKGCYAAADVGMAELALVDWDDHDEKANADGVSLMY